MPVLRSRRLWRGLDRARLRKLLHSLDMLDGRDYNMAFNTPANAKPFFFTEGDDAALKGAITQIRGRIETCLNALT